MRSFFFRILLAGACGAAAMSTGCEADVHDNALSIEDPEVDFTTDAEVDVDNVEQGATVPVNIDAKNVYPVAPEATPPAEHQDDAVYFKIFLDDVESEPLTVTAEVKVSVKIAADVEPGDHKLICRVFMHDGTPTSTKVEISIKVKASGEVSVPADAG